MGIAKIPRLTTFTKKLGEKNKIAEFLEIFGGRKYCSQKYSNEEFLSQSIVRGKNANARNPCDRKWKG